jgi:fimbrial isopeptide formation D2 family protein/LPXTG-motif cell wall-anchored protein
MNKTPLMRKLAISTLAFSASFNAMQALPLLQTATVYAQTITMQDSVTTSNGVASFGKGEASIQIKANENQTLVGKKFTVYALFAAENSKDGESINYTWNDAYKTALQTVVAGKLNKEASKVTEYEVIDYIQSINTNKVEGVSASQKLEGDYSAFRTFVEEVRDEIVKEGLTGSIVSVADVDTDGNVTISGLEYGYYVVDEIQTQNNNSHSAASLCMVSTANPKSSVNIKSDYPSITKKINEDDNSVGWNDVADFEIGQTVPYKYESAAPNMNGYDTYYFAMHDRMDEALTFDATSVSVKIGDVTLKEGEFSVIEEESGVEGYNGFRIEIEDLKGLIDKYYADELDKDGKTNVNGYGQSITVTYNATLNDKAAERTGRAGFENDVRLEFSNNPDSNGTGETGFTPWDTVVCFTFEIDGLKVNNYDKTLEGAKFRLYSDEDCTQEVYVKESDNGYIVINRDSVGGTDHTGGTQPKEAVEMVSDEDGVFKILGLDQGTYYLKETDSPDGYREVLDPIKITITPTYTEARQSYVKGESATTKTLAQLSATASSADFFNGLVQANANYKNLSADAQTGTVNITVVNQVGSKLPITGSNMTILALAAGAGLMVVAVAGKRRKHSENV